MIQSTRVSQLVWLDVANVRTDSATRGSKVDGTDWLTRAHLFGLAVALLAER